MDEEPPAAMNFIPSYCANRLAQLQRGCLGWHDAPQRFRSLVWERYLPEIRVGGDEFERHTVLAIRLGFHGDHFALCFLPAAFIGHQELLTKDDRSFQNHPPAMAADGMRARLGFELLILFVKALDYQIHKNRNSGGTAPFNAAKVKDGHGARDLSFLAVCAGEECTSV